MGKNLPNNIYEKWMKAWNDSSSLPSFDAKLICMDVLAVSMYQGALPNYPPNHAVAADHVKEMFGQGNLASTGERKVSSHVAHGMFLDMLRSSGKHKQFTPQHPQVWLYRNGAVGETLQGTT